MSINDRSLDGMLDRFVLVASGYGALMHMKGEGVLWWQRCVYKPKK